MSRQMKIGKHITRGGTSIRLFLRAFHNRNYYFYFAGKRLSLTGTWIQHSALNRLV